MRNLRLVTLAALGFTATMAAAQNRIPNADLNDPEGDAGWSLLIGGSLAWDANDVHECPNSGSALATSLVGLLTVVRSPCTPITAGEMLDASVWIESSPLLVALSLQPFSATDCALGQALPILPLVDLDVSTSGWQPLAASSFLAPATAQSARLEITSAIDILITELFVDRAFLGSPGHLFSDDFEGGAVCRWSFAVTS